MFPSGPGAIAPRDHEESTGHLVSSPEVVIRPIQFAAGFAEYGPAESSSVNQRFPSGPAEISGNWIA
jgi:hypothetical protein